MLLLKRWYKNRSFLPCINVSNADNAAVPLRDPVTGEQELSALCHGGSNVEALESFLAIIEQWEGDNLTQKVENYLLSLGVTKEEIQSIRQILLTE